MISLKKILLEVLNNYSIEFDLFIDRKVNTYDVLNEIRALEGVTIVSIITPEGYSQEKEYEYIRIRMKFVTRGEADKMLQNILDGALAQNDEDNIRIQGIRSMKIRKGTLNKL
jgi:hypothetical protein